MGSKKGSSRHQVRNFTALALFQVVQRIGWVFKTESIVMPAFMDFIGGGPVLRGLLPMLNRFGFAIPPILFARRLKITRYKKLALMGCAVGKALPFLGLTLLWRMGLWSRSDGDPHVWLPWLFLALYGVFFALVGMGQLAEHTLQGKLIAPRLRGRLMMVAIVIGAPASVVAAWWWMPDWLAQPDGGFGSIFAMPAMLFATAGLLLLLVKEEPDDFHETRISFREKFRESLRIVAEDRSFRQLALVAALFSAGFMLFPHYQALGRERLGLGREHLVFWICAQNLATALASILAGPLADRFGNRMALHVAVLGAAVAPILSFLLSQIDPEVGSRFFWVVFLPIGLTPLTLKLMANYTLEFVDREHHPRYVSTLGACLALPVLMGAPLVGLLVHVVGYDVVFAIGAAVMLGAGGLTFWLEEPRHRKTPLAEAPRWTE